MTDMTFTDAKLGESYREIRHPSGLTIRVLHKDGYKSSFALFATKYGSIDTKIAQPDGSFRAIPEGTAHFLEHKLFESEDLDAFERFAKTGANANAFTSFDMTAYLFSCADRFSENLEILLDFVQSPYFTEETVRKEQGIIGQEIRMYRDSADWEVEFNLLRALYHHHPVRIDIAGTEQTIAQISADLLYDCYRNFYDLHNMVLAVAGKATAEEVLAVADKMLAPAAGRAAVREFVPEPFAPAKACIEEHMPVNIPQFALGYKEAIRSPERTEKEVLAASILLDAIAGRSSELYKKLLEEGLINTGFGSQYFYGFGYANCEFSGESADPFRAAEEIRKAIAEIRKTGVSAAAFERARRKRYGRTVMNFNDVDTVAQELAESYFAGSDLFATARICRELTLEDVNARLADILDDDTAALSVILPKDGKES